ncbi:hypothetical protein SAMN06265219_101138 [Gracilimonas mengyeensis]|uniref:Uncharacterized protein n=1 Tax=Gracilimonas mengyeensis TaxID=1302730 RepID=A0A521AHH0_9BACT|nr:hypothetical protein SAMN06265219_101138 [Gracilimonas mengyeensis]
MQRFTQFSNLIRIIWKRFLEHDIRSCFFNFAQYSQLITTNKKYAET